MKLLTSFDSENRNTLCIFAGTISIAYLIYRAIYRYIYYSKNSNNVKLPPALPRLPLVESLPFVPLYPKMHKFLAEKQKILGDVIAFYAGSNYVVTLNSWEAIEEALTDNNAAYSHKAKLLVNEMGYNPLHAGISYHQYDDKYRLIHNKLISIWKEFGYGSTVMEELIYDEISEMMNKFRNMNGKSFCPDEIGDKCSIGIAYRVTFGKSYPYDEESWSKMCFLIDKIDHLVVVLTMIDFCKPLIYLPQYRRMVNDLIECNNELLKFVDEDIKAALASEEDSFIRRFLSVKGLKNDMEELRYTIRDLLVGGTERTSHWGIILLGNHRHILRKLQNEIDKLQYENGFLPYSARYQLPYLQTVILELFRYTTVVPLGFTRTTTANTKISGYFIPKGTKIVPNIYGAHMNPAFWKDPEVFNPDRFLNAGEVILQNRVIPFGLGGRSCTGQVLGRQEIFFKLFHLVKNFDILPPEGETSIKFDKKIGLVSQPSNYKLRMIVRNI